MVETCRGRAGLRPLFFGEASVKRRDDESKVTGLRSKVRRDDGFDEKQRVG